MTLRRFLFLLFCDVVVIVCAIAIANCGAYEITFTPPSPSETPSEEPVPSLFKVQRTE